MDKNRVLNCIPSESTNEDWSFEDAMLSGVFNDGESLPRSVDLRERWWKIDDQGRTGACVGYATAYGLLRWHYVKKRKMARNQKPSARFIWMANKETDDINSYPSTFLESEGTQTKLALRVAQKFGCVVDSVLPMKGALTTLSAKVFYTQAAQYRISSYHNLGTDLNVWKRWLAFNGPILTRLNVEKNWMNATTTNGVLSHYDGASIQGGHAVCLVGYTEDYFIVRNSWGKQWGDQGFAYASPNYSSDAFTEAYGAVF